jgi:hypothetical protein
MISDAERAMIASIPSVELYSTLIKVGEVQINSLRGGAPRDVNG